MAIVIGVTGAVWGVREPKPLTNFPQGKIRLRVRNTDFARAFVKTSTGIRQFVIKDTGETWEPMLEQGRNERSQST